MIVRNCLELLNELSKLEEKMNKLEPILELVNTRHDREILLKLLINEVSDKDTHNY